ncbi:MAG: nucleoside diphosphate kinase regulator [Planctomycetota bacterium]|nr:MAG: nucleoside diphosphate kinase regulator [Planctomycetota bacterium]
MMRRQIILTTEDYQRLESLLASNLARIAGDKERLNELRAELDRAQVVPQEEVPEDVVTMNSAVALRDLDTNEFETYTLVYPDRADIANYKLSVLAPIGTAIIGYRVGDELKWRVPAGWRRLKVEQVIFQPERAGVLDL